MNSISTKFSFFKLSILFLILNLPCNVSAAWTELGRYNSKIFGESVVFADFDNAIIKNRNILLEIINNRLKESPEGIRSDKNLIEVDCVGKQLSVVKSGAFKGQMATGGFASDRFGPLTYEEAPFKSWTSIDDKTDNYLRDIYISTCKRFKK